MVVSKKRFAVGLDIGSAVVKAVLMSRGKGNMVTCEKIALLDCEKEGILNDAELKNTLGTWLKELGWDKYELIVGVPQYLVTTQTKMFPRSALDQLSGMVTYETQQVSGLSDQRFLHGFHVLASYTDGQLPVLIGVCRESVIDERVDQLRGSGMSPTDFGMNGVALSNAFYHFHPDALSLDAPQLLLDIGADNTTLTVICRGEVHYCSSLMFGVGKLEEYRRNRFPGDEDTVSSIAHSLQALESEIRLAIEHWREQDETGAGTKLVEKIFLSGGGADLPGLKDQLHRTFGCPVEEFGLSDGSGKKNNLPGIACGLALQGLEEANIQLSLASYDVKCATKRKRLVPKLVAAWVLFAIAVTLICLRSYLSLLDSEKQLSEKVDLLNRCDSLTPQLEAVSGELQARERMLLPFVAKGNRARRYLNSLDALGESKGNDDWFVYFGDVESYRSGVPNAEQEEDKSGKVVHTELGGLGLLGQKQEKSAAQQDDFEEAVYAGDVNPLKTIIAMGCTPHLVTQRYKAVESLVEKLNTNKMFNGGPGNRVDILEPDQWADRSDILSDWQKLFQANKDKRYTAFALKIPISNPDVRKPAGEDGG